MLKFNRPRVRLAAAGFGLLLGLSLTAVQMVPFELRELAAAADLVLHGTVASQSVQRDEAGRIYTEIHLEVLEAWKGDPGTTRFTIVCGGGTLGTERSEVSGQATYALGEEVVAFLRRNARGQGVTLGLAQGKFQVWQEARTGRKYARSVFIGAGPAPAGGVERHTQSAADALPLESLKAAVRGGNQ